jgi:multicomponent Na+:H+ antiporter subunit D
MTTAAMMLLTLRRPAFQRWVGLGGAVALLVSAIAVFRQVERAGIQVLQISGWPAPFGITLVSDLFASLLLIAVGIVAVAVTGAAFAGVDPRREAFGYHPLIQILLMGVSGAFLTGDFFNLYVWFEVMLVASFVLMALHRNRAQLEAAYKYVAINLIASSIFLTALGLLYGMTGTLNMADVARVWPAVRSTGMDVVLAALFVIAFSIKAGLFPLLFWLPASYHTPPAAVGAVFAGLLTKVGVYALIRIFTLLFQGGPPAVATMMLVMSSATMVIGLVAALRERDFRRILSFNLVGHIGYTTASLALLTPAALSGAIFYVLHHIIVITNLFLVSGVLLRLRRTTDLRALGGMYRGQPAFALVAIVPIFSLAGVPPLSGFLGKLAILESTFAVGAYWLGGLVLFVGLLTLLSMGRTWAEVFWQPSEQADRGRPGRPLMIAIAGLSIVTIAISVVAGPLLDLTQRAAFQLLQRDEYIRIVLGGH